MNDSSFLNHSAFSYIDDDGGNYNRGLFNFKCSVVSNQYTEFFFLKIQRFWCKKEYLAFSRGSKWARNCCSLFFTMSTRQILDIQEEKNSFPHGLSKRSLFSVRQNYFPLYCCWCTFKSFGQRHIDINKICNKVKSTKYWNMPCCCCYYNTKSSQIYPYLELHSISWLMSELYI